MSPTFYSLPWLSSVTNCWLFELPTASQHAVLKRAYLCLGEPHKSDQSQARHRLPTDVRGLIAVSVTNELFAKWARVALFAVQGVTRKSLGVRGRSRKLLTLPLKNSQRNSKWWIPLYNRTNAWSHYTVDEQLNQRRVRFMEIYRMDIVSNLTPKAQVIGIRRRWCKTFHL